MTRRPHISLRTKLAATLCQMLTPDENGKLVPVIPYEHAKVMTEQQILAVFHFDHDPIPKAEGGQDVHWNLTPRLIPAHREKTATIDIPSIAKGKRIRRRQASHLAVMAGEPEPARRGRKATIASRGFSKQHRPLRSRNTFATRKR